MTPAEIEAAADRIRHLVGLQIRNLRADRVRWNEVTTLRRALRAEFGQRHGWTWNEDARGAQHLFGKRPQWHEMERPPYADHGSHYRVGRQVVALVEQPYDSEKGRLAPERRAERVAWASDRGLLLTTPDFPSWWYPGWTVLCLFHRPGALREGTP